MIRSYGPAESFPALSTAHLADVDADPVARALAEATPILLAAFPDGGPRATRGCQHAYDIVRVPWDDLRGLDGPDVVALVTPHIKRSCAAIMELPGVPAETVPHIYAYAESADHPTMFHPDPSGVSIRIVAYYASETRNP